MHQAIIIRICMRFEIYSNITSMSGGPDPSFIVDPFYHQLSQLISEQPPIDVGVINIKTKEVLELAGKPVTAHNASNQAISVADGMAHPFNVSLLLKLM